MKNKEIQQDGRCGVVVSDRCDRLFFLFEHAVFMHKMFFRSIRYRYWKNNRKFVSESVAAVEAVQSRRDMTVSRRDRTVSRRRLDSEQKRLDGKQDSGKHEEEAVWTACRSG